MGSSDGGCGMGNGLGSCQQLRRRAGDLGRMFVTSDIWTLEMIARSLLLLITSRHSNLSICTLLNKSDQLSCVPVLEKNDRLLIIVLYICVQYIILLNRHATFHRRINAGIVECVQGVTVMSLVKSFQQVNIIFTGTFMYLIGTFRDLFLGLFFLASYCHYWRCH